MGAVGPRPVKRVCLPQGLEVGARSAPQLLVLTNFDLPKFSAVWDVVELIDQTNMNFELRFLCKWVDILTVMKF